MVSSDRIENLFQQMDDCLANLRMSASLSKEALLADPLRLGGAKYYLQVAVECCVDVAQHIIARQGWRTPASYADSFAVLAEQDVISGEFLETARRMVGMRNRLVHLYWDVDEEIICRTLQHDLGDFERFKAAVYAYLQMPGVAEDARE